MTLRRLLCVTWAALARGKDEKELKAFERELVAPVGKAEKPSSRGVVELMAVLGGGMPGGASSPAR